MAKKVRTGRIKVRKLLDSSILALPLLAAGCHWHHQPGGQTIATVDGSAITTSDLRLELASTPPDQRKLLQPRAVQALVDREVLAEYAKSQGMEHSPEYVLQLRSLTQNLLAQRAAQQIVANAEQPITASQVNDYLDGHPDVGGNRRILLLDQIQFPLPDAAVVGELKSANSLPELIAVLNRHGIVQNHSQVQVDTAAIPDALASKLDKLQQGEPLIVLSSPRASAVVITDARSAPLQGDGAEQVARQRIASERSSTALQQRGLALRRQAKISYAKGYNPTPAPSPSS